MIQRFTGKKAVWEHQSQTAFLLSERRSDQNPQIVPVDLIKLFQGERIGAASYLDGVAWAAEGFDEPVLVSGIGGLLPRRCQGVAEFSYPEEGQQYDVLLILRGCTGCPYLYEDISAAHRIVCASQAEADGAAARIAALA